MLSWETKGGRVVVGNSLLRVGRLRLDGDGENLSTGPPPGAGGFGDQRELLFVPNCLLMFLMFRKLRRTG